MKQPSIERYIGFYLLNPFWAINPVNMLDINQFTNNMSEVVFDYQHPDYNLKICRDGMFLLRIREIAEKIESNYGKINFSEHTTEWSNYLEYGNAIVLLFESTILKELKHAHVETRALTNKDAFGVIYENGKWSGCSIATLSTAEKFQNARFTRLLSNNTPLQFNPIFTSRITIPKSVLDSFSFKFNEIYSNKWLVSLLSELTKSISEFKMANFDTALIIAWFIIESILNFKWSAWIDSRNINNRISKSRKENLTGRDYPLSIIMNILELNDIISIEFFDKLNLIRKWRNKIAHRDSQYRCSMENVRIAIDTANKLIEENFQINITLNLGLSISGL